MRGRDPTHIIDFWLLFLLELTVIRSSTNDAIQEFDMEAYVRRRADGDDNT